MKQGIDIHGRVHLTNKIISLNEIVVDEPVTLAKLLFFKDVSINLTEIHLEVIYNAIKKYIDTDYTFYVSDTIECQDLDSNKNLNIFLDWAEKHNIKDRITVWTNWLDYKSKKFNIKSCPFFLSKSYESKFTYIEIEDRSLDKNFLFLNYVPRLHRRKMYNFMKHNNLLKKSNYSFGTDYQLNWHWINFDLYPSKRVSNEDNTLTLSQMHTIIPEYYTSFCSIITESYCFQNDEIIQPWMDKNGNSIMKAPTFITEKTDKSLSVGQPFVIVSTPFFLKKLRELGFKTFDKWWDESYDEIEDDNKRIEKIQSLVLELSEWSLEKCTKVLIDMKQVLYHNMSLNKKLGDAGWRSIEGYHNTPIKII